MDGNRISELIDKYFANTATAQEREELLQWYRSVDHSEVHWPEEEAVFEQRITHVFSEIKRSFDIKQYQGAANQPVVAIKSRRILWKLIPAAAVVLVAFGLSLGLFLDKEDRRDNLVETAIKPGENKALLTLSNGQKLVLGEAETGKSIALENGGAFTADNGHLLYHADEQLQRSSTPNVLKTPKGGQYTMYLPDGTKVSLNVESTLSFPTSFVGRERRVVLEGEAYFEVAKNQEKPFIIEMPGMEIEVLGTAFNVRNYPDEINIATSLVEGSVRVRAYDQELMLTPGEGAVLNKSDGTLRAVTADLAMETAWNQGYFMFNDQHIESIMKQLSRWYDVEVVYQGDMKNMMFSGRILRRSDITEVLDMLQLTGTIQFDIEGRRVIVMP